MTSVIPDIEALLVGYLGPLLGIRIVTVQPDQQAEPWVKIAQLDAKDVSGSYSERLIEYMVQFDFYAGRDENSVDASTSARVGRQLLAELPSYGGGDAVVSRVQFISMPHLPDPSFEPARERYVLTANIAAHA